MTNCKRVTVWLELLGRSSPTHSRRAARDRWRIAGTEYAQNHQSNLHVIDDPIFVEARSQDRNRNAGAGNNVRGHCD